VSLLCLFIIAMVWYIPVLRFLYGNNISDAVKLLNMHILAFFVADFFSMGFVAGAYIVASELYTSLFPALIIIIAYC
jgi:mannose/fructose/N-acetylgalactosamine-specific phosphotransferase system component IID